MVTIEKNTMDGDKKVRVVLYIRVSTQEQAQEGYSIEEQKRRLIAYCKARGWVVVEILVDPGFSGSNLERPAMQALIANIKDYDMVLVYKLDRLSRSQKDTLYLIEEVFLPNGVDFVSINESFDTSTPFGRAMIGILSVFAQLEREQIKERTAMGLDARFREGKRLGSRPPIGYDYDQDVGILVPNEYEAMQIKLLFQLYVGTDDEPGLGFLGIAEYMQRLGYKHKYGDWRHKHTVSVCLSNPVYVGDSKWKDEIMPDTHEPLVSREIFAKAQAIRATRDDKQKGATRSESLLTGFLWCSCCGARVASTRRGKAGNKYYICYSRNPSNPVMVRDADCTARSWRKDELEAIIDYEIRNLIFDDDALGRLLRKKDEKIVAPDSQAMAMAKKVENLDRQIERIMDLYQDGTIPVDILNERVKKLYSEREQLAASLAETSAAAGEELSREDTRAFLDSVAGIWDHATIAEKRTILSVLVNAIRVGDGDRVEIEWTFS